MQNKTPLRIVGFFFLITKLLYYLNKLIKKKFIHAKFKFNSKKKTLFSKKNNLKKN